MKSPDYYIGPHAPHIDANDIVFQYHLDYYTGGAVAHILRAGRKPGETRHDALVNALGCVRRQIEYVEWAEANNESNDDFVWQVCIAQGQTIKILSGDIARSFGLTPDLYDAVFALLNRSRDVDSLKHSETLIVREIEACKGLDRSVFCAVEECIGTDDAT